MTQTIFSSNCPNDLRKVDFLKGLQTDNGLQVMTIHQIKRVMLAIKKRINEEMKIFMDG
jgi:hypothetical protein